MNRRSFRKGRVNREKPGMIFDWPYSLLKGSSGKDEDGVKTSISEPVPMELEIKDELTEEELKNETIWREKYESFVVKAIINEGINYGLRLDEVIEEVLAGSKKLVLCFANKKKDRICCLIRPLPFNPFKSLVLLEKLRRCQECSGYICKQIYRRAILMENLKRAFLRLAPNTGFIIVEGDMISVEKTKDLRKH